MNYIRVSMHYSELKLLDQKAMFKSLWALKLNG